MSAAIKSTKWLRFGYGCSITMKTESFKRGVYKLQINCDKIYGVHSLIETMCDISVNTKIQSCSRLYSCYWILCFNGESCNANIVLNVSSVSHLITVITLWFQRLVETMNHDWKMYNSMLFSSQYFSNMRFFLMFIIIVYYHKLILPSRRGKYKK